MAENIPPATSLAPPSGTTPATTTTTTSASANPSTTAIPADQPGRPYYDALRAALRQTLDKKRKLDERLALLEDTIFKAETTYLEDTAASGNIVRGFDAWVKGVSVGGGAGAGGPRGSVAEERRRGAGAGGAGRVRDDDRVFSRSSVGWLKISAELDSNTPSHAATPTASAAPGGRGETRASTPNSVVVKSTNKKKRATEKDDDDDVKSVKRGKITYARE